MTSTQILTLVQSERAALADSSRSCPAQARERAAARPRGALAAMHFPRARGSRGGAPTPGLRGAAADPAAVLAPPRSAAPRGALALAEPPSLSARWLSEALPFALTGDQRRAIAEIDADLAHARPMQRLLMGEVGSGKTVVALYAMLRAVEHGHQAALMAPTETLAEQHFATLQPLLGGEPVARGAADRLDARPPARGHPRQARQRRAVADRRHARADRARRRFRARWRSR